MNTQVNPTQANQTQEESITHIWERFNLQWIKVGALSGLLAGTVVMIVACLLAAKYLGEWSQPFKLLGAGVYGGDALEYGKFGIAGLYGLMLHASLSTLFGMTYAQLVNEHSKCSSLLILGIVTSLIIWVFGGCLFMPTVNLILSEALPVTVNLFLHILFGVSFGLIIGKLRAACPKLSTNCQQ